MGLFEPLPASEAAEEPQRPPRPAWVGPPEAHFAGIVPMRRVLARATGPLRTLIELVEVRVYPQGCLFDISATAFHPDPASAPWRDEPGGVSMALLRGLRAGQPLPTTMLRFAVVLSDGTVATTLHPRRPVRDALRPDQPVPEAPRLSLFLGGLRGGGPGDDRILHVPAPLWLWPAPPAAEFELVVEWPAYDIAETRVQLDGAQLADAGSHAEPYWTDLEQR